MVNLFRICVWFVKKIEFLKKKKKKPFKSSFCYIFFCFSKLLMLHRNLLLRDSHKVWEKSSSRLASAWSWSSQDSQKYFEKEHLLLSILNEKNIQTNYSKSLKYSSIKIPGDPYSQATADAEKLLLGVRVCKPRRLFSLLLVSSAFFSSFLYFAFLSNVVLFVSYLYNLWVFLNTSLIFDGILS